MTFEGECLSFLYFNIIIIILDESEFNKNLVYKTIVYFSEL